MKGLGCLLIDLQDCFLKAMPDRSELTNRAAFVLQACKLLEIPVYLSEQVPEKLGGTSEELLRHAPDAYVFAKQTFSSWTDAGFQERLQSDEISHLLIGGIETPICVYQTVIAARADDMPVTLLSDVISCRRPQDAAPVIHTLEQHHTLHLPSETLFYSILAQASHPAFREFTKLVKQYQ